MKLEEEAKEFMMGKKREFKNALADTVADLYDYVCDNVYDTEERQEAINLLKSFELWTLEAVRVHGCK